MFKQILSNNKFNCGSKANYLLFQTKTNASVKGALVGDGSYF